MRKPHLDFGHPACRPVRELLSTVGSKWAMLVIGILGKGPKRFSELKRSIGDITQKSLTAVLRELEQDGLVERTVTPVIPPRVDYGLTPLGRSLSKVLDGFSAWAIDNEPAVQKARERFNAASRSSREGVQPQRLDARTS